MSIQIITLLMFGFMIIVLATGLPVAFVLGSVALIFGLIVWGPSGLDIIASQATSVMTSWVFIAGPLYIFMAMILERAGIADNLYKMIYLWIGRVKGGLAVGTVFICAIFAAMVGVVAAATITMGLIALPSMLKRNYDKRIAIGCISAGGALGQLIPPSVVLIIYAFVTNQSVGRLYAAAYLPGILMAILFIAYILIRCRIQPTLGPPIPIEEAGTWKDKFQSLKAIILPALLILAVMGTLFGGICTPTESAAIGAIGSLICVAIYRKFTFKLLQEVCMTTFKFTGFVTFILIGSGCFSAIYAGAGAKEIVEQLFAALPLGDWGILILMQLSFFVMGMFLDDIPILMLTAPIYVPIIKSLGFNADWFAILFMINMQMAYLTPPFGMVLFYMKSVVPKNIGMGDIYSSIWPFVTIQGMVLVSCMMFPQIVLFLPNLIFNR
jgi:tripartite ATP-independent transporter DctM subunit